VDRRIGFIAREIDSLTKALQAAQFLLDQWKQNEERGNSPAIPTPSIGTMKSYVRGMRRNVDSIDEILDSTGD
jgi:hypothetical protein